MGAAGIHSDHERTPGALNPDITQENIGQTVCIPGYTKTIRPRSSYTSRLKAKQLHELGLPGTMHDYHEDHLVPLCVGGAPSDPRDLWPQPVTGRRTDKIKNQLEGSVCRAVCGGAMTLQERQAVFLDEQDWTKAYEKFFGLQQRDQPGRSPPTVKRVYRGTPTRVGRVKSCGCCADRAAPGPVRLLRRGTLQNPALRPVSPE